MTSARENEPARARIDKAALFARLRYTPHAGQRAVHESKARFRSMACGVRFGKSTCAAMEAVCAMLAPCESSIGWAVAPTYELSKLVFDRVRVAILEHFPHRVIDDDQRSQRFVVQNFGGGRSELRSKSAENPTSLLGEGLDYLICDEVAKLRAEIWESYLAPRLVDRKGWALLISTPRGTDWFYEFFRRGQNGRDPEFESWRAPTTDNPNIKEEVIAAEKRRITGDAFAQEYEARFLGEENERCEACGNPSDSISRDIVYADYESEPRCKECGEIVDTLGRTRVHRSEVGRPSLAIDLGPGLRSQLRPDQDFDTEIAIMRAELERGREKSRAG